MATADTAKLLASLDLQDAMSPKLKSAMGNVSQAESGIGRLGARLTNLGSTLRGGLNTALSTFGGRLRQIATAGLGLLGIGGIFTLGKILTDAISKARAFGLASQNLAELLHAPIEQTSRLSDALDYFGITAENQIKILAMLQRNVGNLTLANAQAKTTIDAYNKSHDKDLSLVQRLAIIYPKASAFIKQYRLNLFDANGHVLTGYKLLLQLSTYWDQKGIPQQTKVAALQKLLGRSYLELLPILRAGRAELEKQFGKAMVLTAQQLADIKANEAATRDWTDAFGDLETQIGIKLLPTLTKALQAATSFVEGHGADITEFIEKAVEVGKSAVNTIVGVAEEIGGIWDKIPAPMRDFILKFAVGERVVKFLFGVSPIEIAAKGIEKLGGGLLEGVAKGLASAGVGKAFVQPVFVTNPGFGGVGGGGGGGVPSVLGNAAGAGGLALFGVAAITGITLGVIAGLGAYALYGVKDPSGTGINGTYRPGGRGEWGIRPGQTPAMTGGLSLGDRDELRKQTAAAVASAASNAKTAEHTEALSAGLLPKQERQIAKLEAIRAAAQRQADKREDNRITTNVRIPITIRIAGSSTEAGATVSKSITRDGSPVAY